MLRIRLRRQGARKQPTYRIVVADQRDARDGRFVEVIGHYNPRTEPAVAYVDEARAFHWLGNGARPSDAVDRIFGWTGTRERFSRLKQGEELAGLLGEAEKAAADRPSPTKTRHDAPASAVRSAKEPKVDTEAEAETESNGSGSAEAALNSEADAGVAAEVDTEAEAETESDGSGSAEAALKSEADTGVAAEVDTESEDKDVIKSA